ncbi:MAG: CopG family ribbon-helix-helix protein [Candidatus Bathyarchaeota archaeon]|nr:CopG family ribbon-helix-helix protein [Candidatus Bathyarchaeota archaeon]
MGVVSLSIPEALLQKTDQYIKKQGFANRSEIIRQALRAYLSETQKLGELQGHITATITIVYQRGTQTRRITEVQHSYTNVVLTFLHTHVDEGYCIEVIVAKGDAKTVNDFITALKTNKQISEVKVTVL